MKNYPYSKLPLTWSNYLLGSERNKIEVSYMQNIVRKGVKYLDTSFFITGVSGTGKTSLVLLFIRSIKCLNRIKGEIEPCGVCASCTRQDVRLEGVNSYSGVIWIQPGQYTEDTLHQSVKTALNEASKGHTNTGNEDDVLFVVLDEFQEFSRDLRNKLLLRTELNIKGKNVCFIFLTMRPDLFSEEDLIALSRRGVTINLGLSTNKSIYNHILKMYPNIEPEAAWTIANGSKGRPGLAISYLGACLEKFGKIDLDIACYITNNLRDDWRWYLWQAVISKDFQQIRGLITYFTEELNSVSESDVNKLLQDDIIETVTKTGLLNDKQQFALTLLSQQLLSGISLSTILMQIGGTELLLVEEEAVKKTNREELLKYIEEDQ